MIHNNSNIASPKGLQGREAAPLGINAKSSSPPLENARAERYRLLSEARRIFVREGKKQGLFYPQNFHQTAKCIYSRFGEKVGINKSQEHNKTFYTGVIQCGRVFTCPVCAAKIQEKRRLEISQAFDYAYEKIDKKVILVTFTFPHQKADKLKDLLNMQRDAFVKLRGGNVWTKKKQKIGFSGLIRSLEVTYSEKNGFHPHTHEAWIVDKSLDVSVFRDWLADRWYKVCTKSGLVTSEYKKIDMFKAHSVQITDWASNSDYMAKMDSSEYWGADRELAKGNVKQAKGKGFHPYEFLDKSIKGDTKYSKLFVEFAQAMRGKSQIFWSRNLKKTVGVNDYSDEELARMEEDKADILGHLSREQWNIVVKNSAQGFILDLAETSGLQGVLFWLTTKTDIDSDLSAEIPSEIRMHNHCTEIAIKKRAKVARMSLEFEHKKIKLEREKYHKKQEESREFIRSRTLQYYHELLCHLSR